MGSQRRLAEMPDEKRIEQAVDDLQSIEGNRWPGKRPNNLPFRSEKRPPRGLFNRIGGGNLHLKYYSCFVNNVPRPTALVPFCEKVHKCFGESPTLHAS